MREPAAPRSKRGRPPTGNARTAAQRMADLRARARATLDAPADLLFSDLPDTGLLELIRVANHRRLPHVLMEAAAELAQRGGCRVEPVGPTPDDAFTRRLVDLEARLVRLEKGQP